jgi:adenosine deaminase
LRNIQSPGAQRSLGNVPAPRTGRIVTAEQREAFRRIPKVELHCHLLGAVRQSTFTELAALRAAPVTEDEIATFYARGARPVGVLHVLRTLEKHILLTPDDFRRIAYEYLEDAAREGVRHAEFFWNPTATLRDSGLPYPTLQAAILDGMRDAARDFGISALLIPSIDREAAPDDAVAMVELLIANRNDAVPGIGIDYRENDRPPELFAEAYSRARHAGLRTTAHAGEFGMPWTNVATALDLLQVDRIDHGYSILESPLLVAQCVERGIVFTVVPTNSYYLRTLDPARWAAEHPIRAMARAGLKLHPNSDDPTLHNVTQSGAWELMYSHLGFDVADLRQMMLHGLAGAWIDDARRAEWTATWPAIFDTLVTPIRWQESTLP